jgi:hypothetical protein
MQGRCRFCCAIRHDGWTRSAFARGADAAGFHKVGIMSYSAKYASAFTDPSVMLWIVLLLTVKIFQRIKDLPNGLCESY